MFDWKIYRWENGTAVEKPNLTQYLVMPIYYEDRLNEELDTASVTLDSVPTSINNGEAFPPKTKFRLICCENGKEVEHYDMVVDHDDVEYYEGAPEICCHRISLIEASVIAQGMHVDNIALTYELRDVSLSYKTSIEDSTFRQNLKVEYTNSEKDSTDNKIGNVALPGIGDGSVTGEIENNYEYIWEENDEDGNLVNGNLKSHYNFEGAGGTTITYKIPKLYCYGYISKIEWDGSKYTQTENIERFKLFELPTITTINIIETKNGITKKTTKEYNHNPEINKTTDNFVLRHVDFFGDNGKIGVALRSYEGDLINVICNDNQWANRVVIEKIFDYGDKGLKTIWSNQGIVSKEDRFEKSYDSISISIPSNPKEDGIDKYEYKICTRAVTVDDRLLCKRYTQNKTVTYNGGPMSVTLDSQNIKCIDASILTAKTTIYLMYQYNYSFIDYFKKGVKYNAFDLLRKSILTCDSYYTDVTEKKDSLCIEQCPIKCGYVLDCDDIDISLEEQLKKTTLQETTLEQKNLWEVFIHIGYYIHAIPYLEFCEDDDKFVLNYKRLGTLKKREFDTHKITVFNSRNISEYFSQYDSYVSNLFSPQNTVEEWIVAKTSDLSQVIKNDTCELHTSFPILEIIELNVSSEDKIIDITDCVFEKHIYDCLSNMDPVKVSPAKGNSIYYEYGSNKIAGLSYVAPSVSTGEKSTAIQYILKDAFGGGLEYIVNKYLFKIKYKTQDACRIHQFRPDVFNYMKNSRYEKYPHHEQFYGQLDKIIDSEKFSRQMHGQLIKKGNGVYQIQEYAKDINQMKKGGQLVRIKEDPYYVAECENEFYPDAVFQKVTYSKDFNQLSQIVTIPSEPRFYEVSERSIIRREIRLAELFRISSDKPKDTVAPRLLKGCHNNDETEIGDWQDYIFKILFSNAQSPNYAYTKYIGGTFPASIYVYSDDHNSITSISETGYNESLVPVQKYPLFNGICFEWNMMDNFGVGSFVDKTVSGYDVVDGTQYPETHYGQSTYRYVDINGRAKYFKFRLLYKDDITHNQAQALPGLIPFKESKDKNITKGTKTDVDKAMEYIAGLDTVDVNTKMVKNDNMYIVLNKDNREALSFNYQISLLYDKEYVLFPNLFGDKYFREGESKLACCVLDCSISIFEEQKDINIEAHNKGDLEYSYTKEENYIKITIKDPQSPSPWVPSIKIEDIKSILFYAKSDSGYVPYMAKNYESKPLVTSIIDELYIYPVFND